MYVIKSVVIIRDVRNRYFLANVQDHRHRTAGATDAGEERALASGVTAGRGSVDRLVGKLLFE